MVKNPRAIRDWNNIQYVLAVSQEGSFQAAGGTLRAHQTTVSRRIQALETELGAKLFVRQGHGMVPTPAGKALIAKATEMEAVASGLKSDLAGYDDQLSGTVRISVTEGIGIHWMLPVLAEFGTTYPAIQIDMVTRMYPVNLLSGEADIAVTILRPSDPRLVGLKIGTPSYELFASQAYLKARGTPSSLANLGEHALVDLDIYRSDPSMGWWHTIVDGNGGPAFRSNSVALFLAAVTHGFGIGLFPSFYRHQKSDLALIPIAPRNSAELWFVTHEATNHSARVRVLANFLKARFVKDRAKWFV